MEEGSFEEDMFYVEGVMKDCGMIRFGEDCGVYVLNEGNEWYGKDCDNEEFYDYSIGLIEEM